MARCLLCILRNTGRDQGSREPRRRSWCRWCAGSARCTARTRPLNASGNREEQGVERWAVEPLTEVQPGRQQQLARRRIMGAQLVDHCGPRLLPQPTPEHSRTRPLCSSVAASTSRCSVHCVSTSTLRQSLTAADTSLAIWRVRAPSVTSARNTSWIAAISPFPAVQRGLVNVQPPGQVRHRGFSECDLVADGAALHRDDHLSPSRRYGVAVSPTHRQDYASRTASSNERAGR